MFAVLLAAWLSSTHAQVVYPATAIKAVDGDTLRVVVANWPAPFTPIDVRVKGIDAPEHVRPPAKSLCERDMGIAAMNFARTIVKAGDPLVLVWTSGDHDKYGRLLATVQLADGRDWGQVMVAGGYARPYAGGPKAKWC